MYTINIHIYTILSVHLSMYDLVITENEIKIMNYMYIIIVCVCVCVCAYVIMIYIYNILPAHLSMYILVMMAMKMHVPSMPLHIWSTRFPCIYIHIYVM